MKHGYIILILALIVGGIYIFISNQRVTQQDSQFSQEHAQTSDGMLMKNEVTEEEKDIEKTEGNIEKSVSGMSVDDDVPMDMHADSDIQVFNVQGTNYAFDIREIKVRKGDTVTINFESVDGFHDWVVDEFGAATSRIQSGMQTSVTFVADKEGIFEYYCSVGKHRENGMVGKLIVE